MVKIVIVGGERFVKWRLLNFSNRELFVYNHITDLFTFKLNIRKINHIGEVTEVNFHWFLSTYLIFWSVKRRSIRIQLSSNQYVSCFRCRKILKRRTLENCHVFNYNVKSCYPWNFGCFPYFSSMDTSRILSLTVHLSWYLPKR